MFKVNQHETDQNIVVDQYANRNLHADFWPAFGECELGWTIRNYLLNDLMIDFD